MSGPVAIATSGSVDAVYVPDAAAIAASALSAFIEYCAAGTGESFADQVDFHGFSVRDYRRFWALFLEWADLLWEGSAEPVCTDDACERATFFPDVRLSYVDNLLRVGGDLDPDRPAVIARHADGATDRLTRRELRRRVAVVSRALRALGLAPGDRAVAIGGNNAELVIAALAAMNVGATLSTAATDMATPALLSRFEQVRPSVLFADFGADHMSDVVRGLPTLRHVVVLGDVSPPSGLVPQVHRLSDLIMDGSGDDLDSPRFPFNHPQYVLFTSGTTGAPKGIVHGAGGTLLEHVKEHRLHVDLGQDDTLFFHTSAAWMMWHWQLSALASGSAIVLCDAPVAGPETLWRVVAEEAVTVFGTSPPYIQLCARSGYSPKAELEVGRLRAVLSTGSILHEWQYDWLRENVGAVPVQSISGGTDIIGCFALGSPNLPVRRGWLQCRSLGMDVQALTLENGSVPRSRVGELVCRNPFPSRPLGLVGDDGRRFHDTYFEQNPGVWTHGDLIEFDDDGHARMHGRSDGVLNIQGIRIGPAEIYRALMPVTELREAMAVEQAPADTRGRSRLVLLVVLEEGARLDSALETRIRREVARYASAVHVPDLIAQVTDLPVTQSGKQSERAARDAVNGLPVANEDALRNPEMLEAIRAAVSAAAAKGEARLRAGETPGRSTLDRLIPLWEGVLGVAPIHPDDDFFDIGGTSLGAIRLTQAIDDRMGIELPLSILLHAPTPAAMAVLIDGPADGRVPLVVMLRAGQGDRPLVIVHSGSGEVLTMRPLAMALDTPRAIYGIQARGLDSNREPQRRVEEMADTYLETIRSLLPSDSYALTGYSFGGLVAYEMARRLAADGEDVDWLGLIDSQLKHSCLPPRERWQCAASKSVQMLRRPSVAGGRLARYVMEGIPPSASVAAGEPALPPLIRRLEQANMQAFDAYVPPAYDGPATYFAPTDRTPGLCSPLPAWRRSVRGRLTVEPVPGNHRDMIREPQLAALARAIDRHLGSD